MKQLRIQLLKDILALTNKPGNLRAFLIGLLFPEFAQICAKLAELSGDIENNP